MARVHQGTRPLALLKIAESVTLSVESYSGGPAAPPPVRRVMGGMPATRGLWFERLYASCIGGELIHELTLLKAMQEDIHRIYRWPFDTGVVVRLSLILFSVTAITLSKVIASFLVL